MCEHIFSGLPQGQEKLKNDKSQDIKLSVVC